MIRDRIVAAGGSGSRGDAVRMARVGQSPQVWLVSNNKLTMVKRSTYLCYMRGRASADGWCVTRGGAGEKEAVLR